jgi:L-fuculose-phosphate aldolase
MNEEQLRLKMIQVANQMYARDFISELSGNVSARLADGNILTTSAGVCKADLAPQDLVVVNPAGELQSTATSPRPKSELPMHLDIFRQRPDVESN